MRRKYIFLLIIIGILALDQCLKIWVKTNLVLGESILITDWFQIHFIENNGMAFGIELGGDIGKLFLTLFRLIVITGLILWIKKSAYRIKHWGALIGISFLIAGAIGNLIDSIFYGVLFDTSAGKVATIIPDSGYAPVFFGKVVDMFYFPLFSGFLPSWIPIWGGEYFVFFQPVFNIADASISVGFGLIFLFRKKIFLFVNPKAKKI